MSTIKRFRKVTPQDWKPECQRYLDSFELDNEEPTVEFYLTEPDDYMEAWLEDEITEVYSA